MNITLPAYQHPACVILVDDSASFMDSLTFQMQSSMAIKCFCDPYAAIEWLKQSALVAAAYDRQTDMPWIERVVRNAQRFCAGAVVVVDYAMPQLDGLAFCRALAGLPCKKILFTGEANEMVAVEAFNQGLIDRYLKKRDPGVVDRLELEIERLQQDYFVEKSASLPGLSVEHAFLSDAVFIQLVKSLAQQHGFIEHVVFSDPAGILFFDADGTPTLMVVETQAGLRSHVDTAQAYGAPAALLAALLERQVVPFFWQSGGMYTEKSANWQQYCLPAQVCLGKEAYFWALFDFPEACLDRRAIYSYKQFLRDKVSLLK